MLFVKKDIKMVILNFEGTEIKVERGCNVKIAGSKEGWYSTR